MKALTMRQANVLAIIEALISERGIPPTIREISMATGIRSPNGVSCYLKDLERKGKISRIPSSPRSIRVLAPDVARKAFQPSQEPV